MSSVRLSDLDYLRIAYIEASAHSTDPSTQNGAILVDASGDIIARGSNHFPAGVSESAARWERPTKYAYVEHAERDAIYNAARAGKRTLGVTMYCPWFACTDCARAIIAAGVCEVIGHDFAPHYESKHWQESIAAAIGMLDEAGVKHRLIGGNILGVSIRFNGKTVKP